MTPVEAGRLHGRFVLLGVAGSIAAYKAVDLLRRLTAEGASVQVLMTHSAGAFVGSLTFETLSGHAVLHDPLELLPDERIAHVVAAREADAIVVAPATAHWMAAMANGLAGDVITATCLAAHAPVVVAPAMDADMYQHPATRANVERLRSFGYVVVEPEAGALASGLVGHGRLAEPGSIVDAIVGAVLDRRKRSGDLAGRHVLVTAGGTAEPIDPVRFIGNRSSGLMGAEVARAALERGASVTLVVGQTSVPLPPDVLVVSAPTTSAMRTAVLDRLPDTDVLVMTAAVADFRPRRQAASKLTRDAVPVLDLEPTEDILAEAARAVAGRADRPVLVGFAAETGSLERAADKARRKGVDLLVANDVLEPGSGFAVETNRVTVIAPGTEPDPWPLMSKRAVAERLLDRVVALLDARAVAPEARDPSGVRASRPATEEPS
ncbi:MAG TPA: bifunctional phosphopantothenoylcysteine decarboxylase/phosphopantothenate--cysteine ligase CoaBC [Candidatus Acidoferrales bacterium]|nr:bifunctional phosphopantothenoylcysteine decarboxylase/phosphopantothenate--cysteine ligase CoaBC [Candidatus Acidoferrales bacterium]